MPRERPEMMSSEVLGREARQARECSVSGGMAAALGSDTMGLKGRG